MANELLLRIVDLKYLKLQKRLCELLSIEFKITLIDDSNSIEKYESILKKHPEIINLSSDVPFEKTNLQVPVVNFKISRVFSDEGEQVGWFIPSLSPRLFNLALSEITSLQTFKPGLCCVVDSDTATGSTKNIALKLFEGADFFSPIVLNKNQDLVDIEDLVQERSLIWKTGCFYNVSYLANPVFFSRRTSIPIRMYSDVLSIIQELAPQPAAGGIL